MELREAYEMAVGMVREHGLRSWRVEFDTAKRRAGVCRFDQRVIGLSAPLTRLHDRAEVRDTVLHEVAHALVGPQHGHDAVWRRTAQDIGCSATRCVPSDAPRVPGAWIGICPGGHVSERHRRPERVMSCSKCHRGFSADHVFEWTYRGRPAAMHPNYLDELRSLREGRRVHRLPVGARVRLTVPGEFHGLEGRVVKVGRTRYHVQSPRGVLTVVFAGAEPVA